MTQRTATALVAHTLTKDFGKKRAVSDLSLHIGAGEIVALIGANGAGKSTFFDLALGLTTPSSGTITLFGMEPKAAVRESRVGAVLQSGGLLPDITVGHTVKTIDGLHPHTIGVAEALRRARLEQLKDQKVRLCSGGEQQRLRFAMAILPDPDLLILDEPTTGMDIYARHEFWQSMRAGAMTGQTVIFSTHYLEEAQRYADRIIVMKDGNVRADGPVEDFTDDNGLLDTTIMAMIAPEDSEEEK